MHLATDRLRLREFTLDDLDAVHAYASDPEVCRYVEWGPNTIQTTRAFLAATVNGAEVEPRETYTLAVTQAGRVLGAVELSVVSEAHRRGVMGYVLRRDAWGEGIATEATKALLG